MILEVSKMDSNKTLTMLVGVVLVISVLSVVMTAVRMGGMPVTGAVTGTTQLTVAAITQISLPTNTVNFGTIYHGNSNDTSGNNPYPFTVQNDGTVKVNVTINATDLFTSTSNPTSNYRFAVNTSTEGTCYDPLGTLTTLTNMPAGGSPTLAMAYLNNTDSCDLAEVEIYVTVPGGESLGAKTSTVTFTATQA